MEKQSRIFSPEILLEEYREILKDERIEALPLIISGNSMSPFLIHGRDKIYLSRLNRPVKRGDALLYKRDSGEYVFHRVYKIEANSFCMVGDAQTELEKGIRPDQIIAIMTGAERKGKKLYPGSFWWEFFEKIWIRILPFRPFIWRLYKLFHR